MINLGLWVAAAVATSSSAYDARGAFGKPGQVVVESGFAFSASKVVSPRGGSPTIDLAPRVLVFVLEDLALTVGARLANEELRLVSTESYGGSVGVAYAVPIAARISLLPALEVGYLHSKVTTAEFIDLPAYAALTVDREVWDVRLSVPIIFHVAPHLFFGGGPRFGRDLSRTGFDEERTRLSLVFDLGGWF